MKQIITILFVFYFINSNAQWSFIKDMPKPLSKHTATVYNGKIFVFGSNYTMKYDPEKNTWQTLDSTTKIGDYKNAVTINDKIYIAGGIYTLIYKPQNNDWDTLKPNIPEILYYSSAVSLNNKLYVMGGQFSSNFLNTVLVYNPDSNNWTYKNKMFTARRLPSASVAEGKIYVTGGFANDILSINEVYNPANDEWQWKEQLPSRRYQHIQGNVLIKGSEKIFIAGGYNDNELNDFHIYDPKINKWFELNDMNEFRYRFSGVSIGNCIYVFGGFNSSGVDRKTSEKICINSLGNINESEIFNNFFFPNPTSGKVNFKLKNEISEIEFFDINCKKISLNKSDYQSIDITDLAEGIYFFVLKCDGKLFKGKIIKKDKI